MLYIKGVIRRRNRKTTIQEYYDSLSRDEKRAFRRILQNASEFLEVCEAEDFNPYE